MPHILYGDLDAELIRAEEQLAACEKQIKDEIATTETTIVTARDKRNVLLDAFLEKVLPALDGEAFDVFDRATQATCEPSERFSALRDAARKAREAGLRSMGFASFEDFLTAQEEIRKAKDEAFKNKKKASDSARMNSGHRSLDHSARENGELIRLYENLPESVRQELETPPEEKVEKKSWFSWRGRKPKASKEAQNALKEFEVESPSALLKKIEKARADEQSRMDANAKDFAELNTAAAAFNDAVKNYAFYNLLAFDIRSDDDILIALRAEAKERMTDEVFLNILLQTYPADFPQKALLMKARNALLRKLSAGLQQNLDELQADKASIAEAKKEALDKDWQTELPHKIDLRAIQNKNRVREATFDGLGKEARRSRTFVLASTPSQSGENGVHMPSVLEAAICASLLFAVAGPEGQEAPALESAPFTLNLLGLKETDLQETLGPQAAALQESVAAAGSLETLGASFQTVSEGLTAAAPGAQDSPVEASDAPQAFGSAFDAMPDAPSSDMNGCDGGEAPSP